MKEITKTYDPVRLESIKRMLDNEAKGGKPRYYEIWVDDVKVVEKTNDPQVFTAYEDFLYADTQNVTINVYTGSQSSAHIVSRYNFIFEEEEKSQGNSMNGIALGELDAKINEKVSEKVTIERERWDCNQVKIDLATTQEKLKEAEDYAETLQGIIDETKRKLEEVKGMNEITSIVKELAGSYLLGKKTIEKGNLSGNEKPEGEASFKMKSSEGDTSLSEDEKYLLKFGKSMRDNFSREEFELVISILNEFVKDKSNIRPVAGLLNIKINEPKTQTQNEKI